MTQIGGADALWVDFENTKPTSMPVLGTRSSSQSDSSEVWTSCWRNAEEEEEKEKKKMEVKDE